MSSKLLLSCLMVACGPSHNLEGKTDSVTSGASTNVETLGTSSGGPPTSGPVSDPGTGSSSVSTGLPSASTSGEGCSLLCMPDLPDSNRDCDRFTQNCPEGEKCIAQADSSGNICVEVMGDRQPGESCTAMGVLDDCAKGAVCWYIDRDFTGLCIAQCSGTPESPVCPNDGHCSISGSGFLSLCFLDCDPLLQDCPGDALCVLDYYSVTCVPPSPLPGQINDVCFFGNDCEEGLACIPSTLASAECDPNASKCCQPFCKFPNAPCPNLDQECVQLFDPMDFPPGDPKSEVGVCALP